MAKRVTWTEKDDTHTAKAGDCLLRVWPSEQFKTYSWSIVRGHIVKAGNTGSLEDAQKAAQAAVTTLGKS